MNTCATYFVHQWNVCDTMGLFALQKCIATMRLIAYGVIVDALNKYCCMGETQQWKT